MLTVNPRPKELSRAIETKEVLRLFVTRRSAQLADGVEPYVLDAKVEKSRIKRTFRGSAAEALGEEAVEAVCA